MNKKIEDKTPIIFDQIFLKRFNLDIEKELVQEAVQNIETGNFKDWFVDLIKKIEDVDTRLYEFESDTTEFNTLFRTIATEYHNSIATSDNTNDYIEKYNIASKRMANKLLSIEHYKQEKLDRFTEILKGSLFITIIDNKENEDIKKFIAAKVEYTSIIDDENLTKEGLPCKHKVYKVCIIDYEIIDDNIEINSIQLGDHGKTNIAEYWWRDFCGTIQVTDDAASTYNSFNMIKKIISSKTKKYKDDYYNLYGNLLGYYQTRPVFKYKEMIEYVIGDYRPENSELNIEELKKTLNELPSKVTEKSKFETHFEIIDSKLKSFKRRKYKLENNIDLLLKDNVKENIIVAVTDSDGNKCIRIQTDSGYSQFPKAPEEKKNNHG